MRSAPPQGVVCPDSRADGEIGPWLRSHDDLWEARRASVMPIATAHRPAIARTPKSPTFLPYSTVPVTQPPAVSLNLGYNKLFVDESPETLFISQGGSKEVMKSDHLVTILTAIASGIEVWKLIDRDDMADYAREQKINSGVRVLNRRELEEYLYDREVIRNFLLSKCCDENVIGKVLDKREEFISGQHGPRNVKEFSRSIFDDIRRIARLPNLGNSREEFALQFLVPALRKTDGVYDELRGDVFGP